MQLTEEQQPVLEGTACASCGLPADHTTSTPLCTACRKQFIAYPIPLWIKAFGGVLLCILLFSLFTLPKNLQTGMHYKRGLKAMDEKNYQTAENELQKVLEQEPDYLDARCQLLIASYYNRDFSVFFKTSESLDKKQIEDDALFSHMQSLVNKAVSYYPKDSFTTIMQQYNMDADSIPESIYRTYIAAFPEDHFAAFRLAGILSDQDRYKEADSVVNQLLHMEPDHYGALILKASMKREQLQIDSSYYYINRLLAGNHQDVTALSSKVRTLLKEKKDDEALKLALQTTALNGSDAYSLASLAMAYHFTNKTKDRDDILHKIAKDSSAAGALTYVKDIINGKEKFRN
jgi:tetratricopeptide (TPR) repeat protein